MAVERININGIDELRFNLPGTTTVSMPRPGSTAITSVGFNGINSQTANYTVQASDNEKLLVFNSSSGVTATLPQPGTSGIDSNFVLWFADIGSGTLTVTPTDATIDGGANLSLGQNQGVIVFTDGSNYFSVRGATSGSGLILETDGTPNGSQSLLNLEAGTNVTLTDDGSGTVTIDAGSGSMMNPMMATGDLIVGGAVTGGIAAPVRLGVGSNGQVLTVTSGSPAWQSPAWGNGEATFDTPVLANFTQENFGAYTSASSITSGGVAGIRLVESTLNGTVALRNLLQAIPSPSSPWTVQMRLRCQSAGMSTTTFGGIVLKDSVAGKYISWMIGSTFNIIYDGWNGVNGGTTGSSTKVSNAGYDGWLGVYMDGTNLNFQWSADGNYFTTSYQVAAKSFLTNGANYAGFGLCPDGAAPLSAVFDCFSFSIT